MNIPRTEHPRPQLTRDTWINLNGEWDFEIDSGKSGFERRFYENGDFTKKIMVPFCPESKLSGIECKDFMEQVWYRRSVKLDSAQLSGRVLLHFGAVDYKATVFVNGKKAGEHFGGYISFELDITPFAVDGENVIVVSAEDDNRSSSQPCGKQSARFNSHDCDYTRTTGIWQTVWLEFVPKNYIKNYKLIPDPENSRAMLTVNTVGRCHGEKMTANVSFNGALVYKASSIVSGTAAYMELSIANPVLWDVGAPNLYDIDITMGADHVTGYFGMRSVALTDNVILINGRPVFQRLVLDQGFYPDGIYTAPSDSDLKGDIEKAMAVGFNGARLHQKIFEERFLYWADKLGYIVWGEHASWGFNIEHDDALMSFLPEWNEELERDFNHPSIIGWCPFNETYKRQNNRLIKAVYDATKRADPTRPVIDTSGYVHVDTDVFDIHDYEQDAEKLHKELDSMNGGDIFNPHDINGDFDKNMPYFVSEYGGTWWNAEEAKKALKNSGWGYGNRPKDIEEVYGRIDGLTSALLGNPRVCAYCYTQLTDIEQEQNGIYSYDRTEKFDASRLKAIFGAKAAIEK